MTNTQTLCDTTDELISLTSIDITKLGVDIDLLSNPDKVVAKLSMNLNERNYDKLTYHLHELYPRHLINTRPSMGRINSFLLTTNVSLTNKDIYSLHPNESATDSVMSLFIHWYVLLFSAFILRIGYRLILIVFIQRVEVNIQDQKVSFLPIDFLPRLCHATP